MANTTSPLLPRTEELLKALGERIRLARLRRRLQAKQVAERAGMTEVTLRRVERGMPGVTIGAYLAVLQVLQLHGDIEKWVVEDPLGRHLQDTETHGGMRPRRFRRALKAEPVSLAVTGGNANMPIKPARNASNASSKAVRASRNEEQPGNSSASVSATDLLKLISGGTLKDDPNKNKD